VIVVCFGIDPSLGNQRVTGRPCYGPLPRCYITALPKCYATLCFRPILKCLPGKWPEKTAQVPKSGVISRHIDRGGAAVKLAAILPLDLRRFWPAFIQTAARERQQGAA